jgi:hypothetical protein
LGVFSCVVVLNLNSKLYRLILIKSNMSIYAIPNKVSLPLWMGS